ncbi:MAG: Hsp33 family molecular chaperone HslO [Ignavibacteria bacterium]|nr:Hsp33 family molecular chaperone HslO [Ignavibacteria bacterium]
MSLDVRKQWEQRDRVTRAITKNGMFRAAVVQNSTSARTAQERHELEPIHALILGRALAGSALMASFLQGEERVVVTAEGDGLIKFVYAEALQVGEVRGYVRANANPADNRRSALGEGLLKVQRVLYGRREPVTGIVELRRGDITSDLGYYLTQSEQIPSAFVLDVSFRDDDNINQCVGLLIQALPGARPEDIFRIYDTLDYLERLTEFADKGYSPEDILNQVLPGEIDIISTSPIDFFCRCSLERFKNVLLTLGVDELNAMHEGGHNELVCQYCNEHYYLSNDDFSELKEQVLARRN